MLAESISQQKQKPLYSRRFFSRVEQPETVWVYWHCKGHEDTSPVWDLGLGGLFVQTARPAAVGASVKVDFLVQEGQIRSLAVVRHVGPNGIELKFSAMRDEGRQRLKELMASLLQGTVQGFRCPNLDCSIVYVEGTLKGFYTLEPSGHLTPYLKSSQQ